MLKRFLFLLLVISTSSILAQPTLNVDWLGKYPTSIGEKIIKDSNNDLVICGQESPSANWGASYSNLFLKKMDTLGNAIWSQSISFGISNGGYGIQQLLLDSLNNIFLVGVLTLDPNAPIEEGFLIKYDSQGNFIWEKEYGALQGFNCYFLNAAVYKNRFITVSGFIDSSNNFNRAIVLQYALDGSLQWVHIDTNSFLTRASSIVHDPLGNSYHSFISNCCSPSTTGSLVKMDSIGHQIFQNPIQGGIYHHMIPSVIGIDDSARVYIGTKTTGTASNNGYDCALIQFDTSGTQRWFTVYRSIPTGGKDEYPSRIFFDKENCYLLGNIDSAFSHSKGFITKYGKNGALKWDYIYSPTNSGQSGIANGCLINDSLIAIAGTGIFSPTSWGMFAQIIDTSGTLKSNFQEPNCAVVWDMETIGKQIYFIGSLSDTNELVQDSTLVVKLIFEQANSTFHKYHNATKKPLLIYPNPVTDYLIVQITDHSISNDEFTICIKNTLGEIVLNRQIRIPYKLNLEQLTKGYYSISLTTSNLKYIQSIVKY